MSAFQATLQSQIDKSITQLLSIIIEKYSLPKDEVLSMYFEKLPVKKSISKKESISEKNAEQPVIIDGVDKDLNKMSKPELVELCKTRGLPVSGAKTKLIERLTGKVDNDKPVKISKVPLPKPQTGISLLKKLNENTLNDVIVRKNKFGNYEHQETGLVMDHSISKIFGRQKPEGQIAPLSAEDIELCHKYKLSYIIPDNLDTKINVKDALDDEVKELDAIEDEIVDEGELEEFEEEVELEEDEDNEEEYYCEED